MEIIYGGDEGFTAAICGVQNPTNMQYFRQQIENTRSMIGGVVNDFSQRFLAQAENLYERYNGARAIEIARSVVNQIRGVFQDDVIRYIPNKIADYQIATPVMQRYLMANPMARSMYHEQLIDGYSDSYKDDEPGLVGKDHYEWRRVHDGLYDEKEDMFVQYVELLRREEDDLSLSQQMDILASWRNLEGMLLAKGKDPTSPWNNSL